jgi:hypothetical protein
MEAEEFEQRLQDVLREQSPKNALYKLSDLYFVSSEEQRSKIRADFDFGRKWEFPDDMTLAAHLPAEPDREARIRAMLISLSLIDMGGDDRDIIIALCPIYHSIKAIGKDAEAWFRFFADMSSPLLASHLFRFAARKPEDKSLDAFLLEAEVMEQGLVFKRKAWS